VALFLTSRLYACVVVNLRLHEDHETSGSDHSSALEGIHLLHIIYAQPLYAIVHLYRQKSLLPMIFLPMDKSSRQHVQHLITAHSLEDAFFDSRFLFTSIDLLAELARALD